jgi:transposase
MRPFFWVRIGCPWRYLPSHIPLWQMVYYHFRQFSRTGLGIHLYRVSGTSFRLLPARLGRGG